MYQRSSQNSRPNDPVNMQLGLNQCGSKSLGNEGMKGSFNYEGILGPQEVTSLQ